jgi:adenylate cyclase
MSDISDDLKLVIQALGVGVAVADPEDWSISFENAKFFQWFPPTVDPDAPLSERLTGLNLERARDRLSSARPFRYEHEVKGAKRTSSLVIELRTDTIGEGDTARDVIIAECRDITKQKEVEYMLDSYSQLAERKTRELEKEKERVEKLLLNVMPRSVYEEMKNFGTTTPQRFDSASVVMLDFVDFTNMAVTRDPAALVGELNDMFSAFDQIVELFGCERIKTIGDAYIAVSGLPETNEDHAINVAKVALRMRRYLEKRNASHPTQWRCRIGINTGPVIGSIVGVQKYVYDIFGPAVNLAARLEAVSEPMQICVAEDAWQLLKNDFRGTELGEFEIKGFGSINIYSLDGEYRDLR